MRLVFWYRKMRYLSGNIPEAIHPERIGFKSPQEARKIYPCSSRISSNRSRIFGSDSRGEACIYVVNYVTCYVEKIKAMAFKKKESIKVRSLTKIAGGTSYAVTIPIEYVRELKWRGKQKLEVKLYQDRIIIRDWKPE